MEVTVKKIIRDSNTSIFIYLFIYVIITLSGGGIKENYSKDILSCHFILS